MTITRSEFIRAYARESGLPEPQFSAMGVLDVDGHALLALPCACGDKTCQGWALLSAEQIITHLTFHAPDALRIAYRMAVQEAGGER